MLPSFLLSLREGLEAALIIGIVIGALYKIGQPELKPVVWAGTASAAVISVITAGLLILLGARFEGRAEEIFEGFAMLLAAGILTWMVFWMRARAETLKTELEMDVRRAAIRGGAGALFLLAFLSVSREGLELALFLAAARMTAERLDTFLGALLGLTAAVLLGWVFFTTTRSLSLKRFFQVTNILLILFAAGLVAHGVHELNEAGIIPPVIEHVWDINHILDEGSLTGQILKALFGYNGNPSLTEVLAFISYFILIGLGLTRINKAIRAAKQANW